MDEVLAEKFILCTRASKYKTVLNTIHQIPNSRKSTFVKTEFLDEKTIMQLNNHMNLWIACQMTIYQLGMKFCTTTSIAC